MGRHTWKQWLVVYGALALLVPGLVVSTASADDDDVERRLGKFGKLSSSETRKIMNLVSKRMKRAADMTNDDDPLRMAVSQALYGGPVSGDAMKAAKVRLRLYAGLNEWALDNLFAPRPGAVASCTSQFGLRKQDCEALLAASGQIALSDAARLGAGKPVGMAPAYARQPARPTPAQSSRFGRYDSGYRGNAPQPAYTTTRSMPAARRVPAARPTPAPAAQARRMPAAQPRPVAAAPNAASVAQRKAEYERKRQEYLERKRAEMEARKSKIVAIAAGERVQRGPATAAEAEAAGLDPSQVAQPAAASSKSADKASSAKAEPSAEVAQAPEKPAAKPALDNSFLEGLMDDPLGSK